MKKNKNRKDKDEKYYTKEEVVALLETIHNLLKETIEKMKGASNA